MDALPTETMYHVLSYISPEHEIDSQAAALRVCWLWHDIVQHITKPARNQYYVTYIASENGHNRLLCWLLRAGYQAHSDVAQRAVLTGNMRVIRCLFRYCREYMARLFVDDYVVKYGKPNVVKYFLSRFRNEPPVNFLDVQAHCQNICDMYESAICVENMPVVKMFAQSDRGRASNYGLTFATCRLAVECGSPTVFEWALSEQHHCNISAIIALLDDKTPDMQQRFIALLANYHPNHEAVIAARGRIANSILGRADSKYGLGPEHYVCLASGIGTNHSMSPMAFGYTYNLNFTPGQSMMQTNTISLSMHPQDKSWYTSITPWYARTPNIATIQSSQGLNATGTSVMSTTGLDFASLYPVRMMYDVCEHAVDESTPCRGRSARRSRVPRRKPCEKQSRRRV